MFRELDITNNNQHQIIAFGVMLTAWSLLYTAVNGIFQLKGLHQKKQYDTKNRIVSMIHGIITLIWAIYQYLPYPSFSQPNTTSQTLVCLFSLAYSVYDLIACIYYKLADAGLLIHHLCCAVGFGTAVFTGYGAIDSIGGLLIAQASNFPMHLRCIIRNYKLRHTKAYQYSQNLYLGIYILARGMFGPFIVLYPCLKSQLSPIPIKIVCSLLILQSFYYIYNMFAIISKKMKNNKEMRQKNIYFQWLTESPQITKLSFYKKADEPKIF